MRRRRAGRGAGCCALGRAHVPAWAVGVALLPAVGLYAPGTAGLHPSVGSLRHWPSDAAGAHSVGGLTADAALLLPVPCHAHRWPLHTHAQTR